MKQYGASWSSFGADLTTSRSACKLIKLENQNIHLIALYEVHLVLYAVLIAPPQLLANLFDHSSSWHPSGRIRHSMRSDCVQLHPQCYIFTHQYLSFHGDRNSGASTPGQRDHLPENNIFQFWYICSLRYICRNDVTWPCKRGPLTEAMRSSFAVQEFAGTLSPRPFRIFCGS